MSNPMLLRNRLTMEERRLYEAQLEDLKHQLADAQAAAQQARQELEQLKAEMAKQRPREKGRKT